MVRTLQGLNDQDLLLAMHLEKANATVGLLAVSRTMKEEEEMQTLAALEATPPLELQERPARATHSNAENAIEEALADLVMAMMSLKRRLEVLKGKTTVLDAVVVVQELAMHSRGGNVIVVTVADIVTQQKVEIFQVDTIPRLDAQALAMLSNAENVIAEIVAAFLTTPLMEATLLLVGPVCAMHSREENASVATAAVLRMKSLTLPWRHIK